MLILSDGKETMKLVVKILEQRQYEKWLLYFGCEDNPLPRKLPILKLGIFVYFSGVTI